MSDFQQEEQKIMQQVSEKLSQHDYFRKLRAELKVLTYSTAKKMVENNQLQETEQMKQINEINHKDELILALIADLMKSCGLKNSLKMLQLESSCDFSQIDLNSHFPNVSSPYFVQYINK